MVRGAIDAEQSRAVIVSNRCHIGIEIRLNFRRDQIDAILCGEDDMCEEADEGIGHMSWVVSNPLATPLGSRSKILLVRGWRSQKNVRATPGYFIEPRWGSGACRRNLRGPNLLKRARSKRAEPFVVHAC
jgi:hypothetical protein